MGFIYFILGCFAVFDLSVWALLSRKIGRLVSWPIRTLFHAFFVLQFGFVVLMYRSLHHSGVGGLLNGFPTPVFFLIYIWHLLLAPVFFVASLLGMTGEGLLASFRFFQRHPAKPDPEPAAEGGFSRRQFIGTMAALTPPLLTGSLGVLATAQQGKFRVRRFAVYLHDLPAALDGMTIAHLTDLHVGQFTTHEMLAAVAEATNRLKADLTVFTGDLINNDAYWLAKAIDTLHAIQPEVVLIKGNHDQGAPGIPFDQTVRQSGLTLLVNETAMRTIRGVPVQLLGLRWDGPNNWQNHGNETPLQRSVDALLKQRNPAAFPILLAHHPHAWDYCGDISLTLSGHTHGGQLMLSENHGFGPAMFRYWSGLYSRPIGPNQPTQTLVVSNGVGNWFPLRVNAPAEIVHLTLRKG